MPHRSDWSRCLIADGDKTKYVTLRLADGRRRRLLVTEPEHRRLAAMGAAVNTPWTRWAPLVIRVGKRALPFVVGLVVTVLVSNLVASVFANRAASQAVKTALVKQISVASAHAYYSAYAVVSDAVAHHPAEGVLRERNRAAAQWGESAAAIDPLIFAHFHSSRLQRRWDAYRNALYDLVVLAYSNDAAHRRQNVAAVRAYLEGAFTGARPAPPAGDQDPWASLACAPKGCAASPAWQADFRWLGLWMLRQRGTVAREVFAAHANDVS